MNGWVVAECEVDPVWWTPKHCSEEVSDGKNEVGIRAGVPAPDGGAGTAGVCRQGVGLTVEHRRSVGGTIPFAGCHTAACGPVRGDAARTGRRPGRRLMHADIEPTLSGQPEGCCRVELQRCRRLRTRRTDNIEMRVRPSDKKRISRAAERRASSSRRSSASAAREAERILREHQTTGRCWRRSTIRRRRHRRPGTRFASTGPGSPMQGEGERPTASGIAIEPFDPGRHDRSGFSCGTQRLDNFLRFSARKQQKDDFTRVFVAVAEGSPRVLGYYTERSCGRDGRPRGGPAAAGAQDRQHSLYLSMIAVDRSRQGKGLGSDLAIDRRRRRSRSQAGGSGRDRGRRKRGLRATHGVLPASGLPQLSGSSGTDVHAIDTIRAMFADG